MEIIIPFFRRIVRMMTKGMHEINYVKLQV